MLKNYLRGIAFGLMAVTGGTEAFAQCQASFTYTVNGSSVTFNNTSTGVTMPAYLWNFGDNTTDWSTSPTHSYNAAGTFYVCLTLWDSVNNCQSSFCDTVFVPNGCGVTVTSTSVPASACNICDGSITQNISGGTPPYSFLWNNFLVNGQNPTNLCPGTYTCTITDANGCVVSSVTTVGCPQGNCTAGFTYTVNGSSVSFTNTTTGVVQPAYYWTFGDNTSSYSANPTHAYNSMGWFTVCLTVWDSTNFSQCSYCDTVYVGVGCGLAVSATSTNASSCQACDGTASVTATGGTPPYSYVWTNGNTTASDSNFCPNIYYTVTVTDAANCSATATVWVGCTPNNFNCSANFTMVQDTNNLLQWYAYPSVTGLQPIYYFWDFGDNTTSTQPYPTHVYASPGSYQICLSIFTADSCVATYCDTSTFITHDNRSSSPIQFLNVIDPATTGMEQNDIPLSYLAPNPAGDYFDIVLGRETRATVRISNLLGSVVYEGQLDGRSQRIDVSNLNNGYYNLSICSDKGSINRKISVMH